MAVRARAEMRWPHLRVRHACDVGGVRAHAFARATVELLVAERLTHAARAPVEQLVPEVEDVHVRSLLEESGEHQARRGHHLLEEGLRVVAGGQALQEVVASYREVHGVSVRGIDGVHERLRLSPGPIAGRRPWDGVARGIDAVRCERSLELVEAKPRPAVAKGEEPVGPCRGVEKRANHRRSARRRLRT